MKKTINRESIQGRVYDHSLAVKTVQNQDSGNYGKPFIGGTISIATDEDCLNVITIHYTYVTEFTSKNTPNSTYTALKTIIDSGKTVQANGKDEATLVKADTAIALNDFYSSRNGNEELVSVKRNEGGFIKIVNSIDSDESKRNEFECDMLINGVQLIEADEEKNIPSDYVNVKGAIFNFRNSIMPVSFTCRIPGGISYFESLDANDKNLVFTRVWGKINSQNIVTKREEESAFGDPIVKEYSHSVKDWTITGCLSDSNIYTIADEDGDISLKEIADALAERERYLADIKKKSEEYRNSATSNVAVSNGAQSFNF